MFWFLIWTRTNSPTCSRRLWRTALFAARVNHESGPFHWQDAAHHIPAANPFMQQVFAMVAGPGLSSEPFASFVDDLAQLLDAAQMDLVLAHFGRREARQDPIMHFYETFLAAYDPELREQRGVYYTPEPVISYIVRSVDHLLRERFGCPEGLADHGKARYRDDGGADREAHRVLVLDPACGTGSFLYAVIDHVREHHQTSGRAGMWRGYVKDHLLPRLFGFELLMAAYAMAHLKLGMQLAALDLTETAREGLGLSVQTLASGLGCISPIRWTRARAKPPACLVRCALSPRRRMPRSASSATCRSWWSWAIRRTRGTRPMPAAEMASLLGLET